MTDADRPDHADAPGDLSERERTLARLDDVTEYAEYKVFGKGRIRNEEKERIRIKLLNTLVSAANAKRALLKDKEIEVNAERIAELEEQQERARYR